jgi:hypothetical protein
MLEKTKAQGRMDNPEKGNIRRTRHSTTTAKQNNEKHNSEER